MQTHVFHVSGMHCKACPALIEMVLADAPGVVQVKASLWHHHVTITGNFGDSSVGEVIAALQPRAAKHGYQLSVEKQSKKIAWREFLIAAPLAAVFLGLFVAMQKLGIVKLINVQQINYPAAFLIGVIASLSTCMAIVGGLTLSISANFAKEGDKFTPQLLFHVGRLVAFFILGGVIAALGAEFQLGRSSMFILNLVVGLVMLILGLNLLDVIPALKRLQPSLPRILGDHIAGLKTINHTLTPALLGVATFFLPCGFTQSMQLYSLSAGSFMTGALIMTSFALGTLPVLGLLSFASAGIHSRKASGLFFKTAGLIVVAFAVINIINALAVAGIIQPLVGF